MRQHPFTTSIAIATAIAVAAAIALVDHAAGATLTMNRLQHRHERQAATIARDEGTVRFFAHHRWLLRARSTRPIATKALRFARAELAWTHREIAETNAAIAAREQAAREAEQARELQSDPIGSRERIVCEVFGAAQCGEALRVTHCEARAAWAHGNPETAMNGQYHGAWQMGSHERTTYGDYADFRGQTEAAHRYFLDAGWRPWQCA